MKKELKNPVAIQVQQKKQTTLLPAKERLTVKQPAVLLQTKETLPKEQQVKAPTVSTSKTITSSLKSNLQTNATTFSQSKLNKKELPSSNMSQRTPINSISNKIVNNQPINSEQTKETEVEELKNLSFQVKNHSDIPLFDKKLEISTAKQPSVQTKEIKKEQQVKASTVPTSKITSSLKQNQQTNATTLSSSNSNKNELPSSKMSQRAPINSTANQIVKNQPTKIEQNKETEVEELKNLSIQLRSHSDIPRFAKEIEPFTKRSSPQINLTLDSNFLNDKDFLNFCDVMVKIASKIRNLKWKIYGKFSNEETSKQIGEVIGKCNTAFSINLNTGNTYFTDRGAESLAFGLKKLTNLRILLININENIRNGTKRMTGQGSGKINESIYLLKKLQKVDYNYLNWGSGTPKLGNYVYQFDSTIDYEGAKYFCEQFEQEVHPLREQLTELSLRKMDQQWCICFYGEEEFKYKVRDLREYSIIYSIQNLPYLTYYSDTLNECSNEEECERIADVITSNKDKRIFTLQDIISNLTHSRLEMISIITIYNKQVINELPLNPKLIIADLFID